MRQIPYWTEGHIYTMLARVGRSFMTRALLLLTLTLVLAVSLGAETFPVREQAALVLISFLWQELHYDIVFRPPQRGVRAMIFPGVRRIEIYARPQDETRLIAYDIAHELGHAIDMTLNTDDTRRQWREIRGIDPAEPWFGCDRCTDFSTPAGDFAETFAFLLLGPG